MVYFCGNWPSVRPGVRVLRSLAGWTVAGGASVHLPDLTEAEQVDFRDARKGQ